MTLHLFFRLRSILKQLEDKDADFDEIKKNLDYTASLLEAVYLDGTRYRQKKKKIPTHVCVWLYFQSMLKVCFIKKKFQETLPISGAFFFSFLIDFYWQSTFRISRKQSLWPLFILGLTDMMLTELTNNSVIVTTGVEQLQPQKVQWHILHNVLFGKGLDEKIKTSVMTLKETANMSHSASKTH